MTVNHDSIPRCNCQALRQATRLVTQLYDQCLAPVGLRVTQYSILANAARLGPTTVRDLADYLVMDRTSLTHNLGPLVRDGLVEVRVGTDRRVREVRLTAVGKTRLAEARPLWADAQHRFEDSYGKAKALELRTALGSAVAAVGSAVAGDEGEGLEAS